MAKLKTQKNDGSVKKFIENVKNDQKRIDSFKLVEIFEEVTGEKATMWGNSIVGFGEYHYKSERSSQEGDWPLVGFSPRVKQISIYIMAGVQNYPELLAKLGKHELSNGCCLYIKKLADVDEAVLKKLIAQSVEDMKKIYKS